MIEFKFPDVGEGIAEGEIVKWMVKEGDHVKSDQHMVDIETDKAVAEIPAPANGTIVKIHHKEGEKVNVGTVIVTIAEEGESVDEAKLKAAEHTEVKEEKKTEPIKHAESKHEPEKKEEHYTASVVGQIEQTEHLIERKEITQQKVVSNVRATPAVRLFAKQMNIDIEKVTGTGPGGSVTVDDIKKAALLSRNEYVREAIQQDQHSKEEAKEISEEKRHHEEKPKEELTTKEEAESKTEELPKASSDDLHAVKKYDFFGYVEHVPLKGVRKAISTHLRNAADRAVMVTHMDEADVTELAELREKEKARHQDFHLTFLPFIVKAVVNALREHPMMNSAMDDEKEEIIVKKYYNIGVAVDTPDGLLVPVIKEADKLAISNIAKEIERLAKAGAERKLDPMDMKGGTFSITNIGSLGGLYATPILNYPEAAILGLGRIYDKASVIDGAVVARKVLPFEVTFDHRVTDGAECARFANKFREELAKQAGEAIE
jgi:pyruvate dehydrogenase E2 component (dihydrolipoamide acetyltransferase)